MFELQTEYKGSDLWLSTCWVFRPRSNLQEINLTENYAAPILERISGLCRTCQRGNTSQKSVRKLLVSNPHFRNVGAKVL